MHKGTPLEESSAERPLSGAPIQHEVGTKRSFAGAPDASPFYLRNRRRVHFHRHLTSHEALLSPREDIGNGESK